MDPEGEVTVHGEDGSEEAQEGEVRAVCRQGRSLSVRGGSEALYPIQGGGRGKPLELRCAIRQGGVGADKNGWDGGSADDSGVSRSSSMDLLYQKRRRGVLQGE